MNNAWTWNDTFATIFTGIAVVFVALVVLIAAITLMGKILAPLAEKERAAKKPAPVPPPTKPVMPAAPKMAVQPKAEPPAVEDGISEEVVAAISAAVTAALGEEAPNYRISSVKKVRKPTRSAWARAERLENTQPF